MSLRFAEHTDQDLITEIYNASIPGRAATADLEPVTTGQRMSWFALHSAADYPLWIWEEQGRAAGWVALNPFYGRPAYRITAEVSLYLLPEYQGKGIGKEMLRYAIQEAKPRGFSNLLGYIFEHNRSSVALFERFGFVRNALLPGLADMGDFRADLGIYQLVL